MQSNGAITSAIQGLRSELKEYPEVKLVAVSKTHPIEKLMEAYAAGIRDFGENKVQDLIQKAQVMPSDVRWHMIGHLQTNKVRTLLPHVHLIQSVDSQKLLSELQKEAARQQKHVQILLQVHIAQEETKYGWNVYELLEFIDKTDLTQYKHLQILGLMGMASFTGDQTQVSAEFESLKDLYDKLKTKHPSCRGFQVLSMGMSSDYALALQAGSTMIRVGSTLFGSRNSNL